MPRDASQKSIGMHARRGIVCHCGASMGSATPSRLGWDEGAGQGHWAYPAEG